MDKGGVSLASKASLATDFPVGSLAGSGYAGCGGTANGHAGTKPFAAAGGSVLLDWIGSGSSAELGRAGADVAYVAGMAPGVRGSGGRTKRERRSQDLPYSVRALDRARGGGPEAPGESDRLPQYYSADQSHSTPPTLSAGGESG